MPPSRTSTDVAGPAPLPAEGTGRPIEGAVELRLAFQGPYPWAATLSFLGQRAIPGVEEVADGQYRRAFAVEGVAGMVSLRLLSDRQLAVSIRASSAVALPPIARRVRRLLDLDADVAAIDAHLARDPLLAPLVAARPGLRVPGAWDPFELAVRGILGQQVSVAAARTLAGRIAAAHGERVEAAQGRGPCIVFPGPERLAGANLDAMGLTRARAAAVTALARAVAEDPSLLAPASDLEATIVRLDALPGIGRWTAEYIAMRGLGEADAFPSSDLGLLRALERRGVRPTPAQVLRRAEAWRPWRAYAALHLWSREVRRPARRRPRREA